MKLALGITLPELIIVLVLLAVIITFTVPSLNFLNQAKTLSGATESLYDTLKLTKSESVKQRSNLNVSFVTGANWCFGISDSGALCDCATANSCQIGGVEKVISSQNFPGITLSITNLTGTTTKYAEFEGIRGTVTNTGSVTLSNTDYTTNITINKLGLITICSNNLRSYNACTP